MARMQSHPWNAPVLNSIQSTTIDESFEGFPDMKWITALRNAMRVAETVDVSRIAVDEAYRKRVIDALR